MVSHWLGNGRRKSVSRKSPIGLQVETLESRELMDGALGEEVVALSLLQSERIEIAYSQCIEPKVSAEGKLIGPALPRPKAPEIQPLSAIDFSELAQRPRSNATELCGAALMESGGSGGSGASVDIDVDSDNVGGLQGSAFEDTVEQNAPGSVVHLNNNDDDNNGQEDRLQTGPLGWSDTDLEPVSLNWQSGGANPAGYILELYENDPDIRIWSSQSKDAPLTGGPASSGSTKTWVVGQTSAPNMVYVEGLQNGSATIYWRIRNASGVLLAQDQVLVTVTEVNMTAYRPQTQGPGYGNPFPKTAVPELGENSPGAGVRRNGDIDAAGQENDLIEVQLTIPSAAGIDYTLTKSNTSIDVWGTSQKATPILVGGQMSLTGGIPSTVWVEWVKMVKNPGETSLLTISQQTNTPSVPGTDNKPLGSDSVTSYPFNSIVFVFSGYNATPNETPGPSMSAGTTAMGHTLYQAGYDVHMYGYYDVASVQNSAGQYIDDPSSESTPYLEYKNAVLKRMVAQAAIFGYSLGGGATYILADEILKMGNHGATLAFTAYVDAQVHDSWGTAETRRPPNSNYHVNYYQTNAVIQAGWIVGAASAQGPTVNVHVSGPGSLGWTTATGTALHHTTIDDDTRVRGRIVSGYGGVGPAPTHSGVTSALLSR